MYLRCHKCGSKKVKRFKWDGIPSIICYECGYIGDTQESVFYR